MARIDRRLAYIQLAAVVIASVIYLGVKSLPQLAANTKTADEYSYVSRVIDGDTLKLSDGSRIRLIGIDTPEVYYSEKLVRDSKRSARDLDTIKAMGKRSSSFTKGLCGGKKVRLEFDIEKKDRYGRTLAYVYLEDGTFVNAKIVEEGYAQVMTIPPNVRYADRFLKLQQDARIKKKGLWADNTGYGR